MTYMLLILEPTGQRQQRTEAQGRDAYARMVQFGDSLNARGLLQGTQSLASHSQAARVSHAGGRAQVLDGPFAEAKEMIGGYFILTCSSVRRSRGHRPRMPGRPVGHGGGARLCPLLRRQRGRGLSRPQNRIGRPCRETAAPWFVVQSGAPFRRPTDQESGMRYMIIVKSNPAFEAETTPQSPDEKLMAAMAGYHEQLARAGVLLDASGLQPSRKGWRIAGFTTIQVRSREEALEWSRRFPNPVGDNAPAVIEVRQLYELDDPLQA
jgi:hypothetical protein